MLGSRLFFRDHSARKPFHLFELRAELEQQQLHPGLFKGGHALGNLFRRPNQTRPQPAIRNRIIFERDALLELRPSKPLLIIP